MRWKEKKKKKKKKKDGLILQPKILYWSLKKCYINE